MGAKSGFYMFYDDLNRRTRASLEDGSLWLYDYNDRDELTDARRFWPDWAPVSGQLFGYDYDNIGNRKSASSGGDVNGCNLRATTYSANDLNQYSSIVTPGYKDICGVALATNSVTVNSWAADRKGEYFHREIPVDNRAAPLWQDVSVSSGGSTVSGGLALPAQSQTLAYDADCNLTNDGVWVYLWGGQNRLIQMTNTLFASEAGRKKLAFTYDFMGRRTTKTVYPWSGGGYAATPATAQVFVYDLPDGGSSGWNPLLILDPQLSIQSQFLWGQDLSGTLAGAGGVGGLLALIESGHPHFAAYDGNGNVTGLVKSDKSTSARYDYSPFGETLRAAGPMASLNPLRFSTKFEDEETGLTFFGFRYYSARLGRWVSRDPVGENGGRNLMAFVLNNPPQNADPNGRVVITLAVGPSAAKGDWATDTRMGNLFPETFRRIEADMKMAGYSAKYARGLEWGSHAEIAAQRAELAAARVLEASDRALLGLAVAEHVIEAVLWANSQKPVEFMENANDYYRHTLSGEAAWADLDAISMAVNLMELTQRYESVYVVLDILLQ